MRYKVTCHKCMVTIGPCDTDNVLWTICHECNLILGGVDVRLHHVGLQESPKVIRMGIPWWRQ